MLREAIERLSPRAFRSGSQAAILDGEALPHFEYGIVDRPDLVICHPVIHVDAADPLREKGKDFALDQFKDGYGYFLAARVRVPFFAPPRAFILYLCWEQANLRGNSVTLEKLTDNEAVVRITPMYFALYQAASHLKDQISFEDYRQIFETIWQDRAEKAGWKLKIEYEGEYPGAICVFRFLK